MQSHIPLTGLPRNELIEILKPLPRFRAVQISKWLSRGILDFDMMTDIPQNLREELKKEHTPRSIKLENIHDEKTAEKFVFSLSDGLKIESVLLSDNKDRFTACLSTQAGCPVGCVFCKTGSLRLARNLSSAEITEQFIHLRARALKTQIDNIVIMGMGEPLLNLSQLCRAISIFTDREGINYSRRRITISTCGIYDGLYNIAKNGPYTKLALSLCTADAALRNKLMPVTANNPLDKIKEALVLYQKKSGFRITLETVLLGGINTRNEDAASVAAFARGLDTVVNLIPWNPVEGLEFEGKPLREPEKKEIENYTSMLESRGLKVTMRHRKGRKVMGACGQLGFN
ncbi:MAG: 23S rRNA (adenine(2503)-C(2))-methyltransferase RlmN [Treponema sp.]|jgi:23S rRNA (adenine2503-C2)-methyltransferase|nr:23S rRNA (adenine(2503)-C(2))-methyltransferase RlmN [Treponema sp.]